MVQSAREVKSTRRTTGPAIDRDTGGGLSQIQRGQQFNTMKLYQIPASLKELAQDGNSPCIVLLPLNDTFDPKTIILPYLPDIVKIGRQTNKSTLPNFDNGFFDSKVLSRAHAEIWANENGRACIKDIRSSNGTFVNGIRLSKENEESEVRELLPGDTLELGIDILNDETGAIIHRKVSARVDHAGYMSENQSAIQNAANMPGQQSSTGKAGSNQSSRATNGDRMTNSTSNGHAGAVNNLNQPVSMLLGTGRHHVTIDMVIKKLSNDLKMSKQVAADLKHATAAYTKSTDSLTTSPFVQTKSVSNASIPSTTFSLTEDDKSGRETSPSELSIGDSPHSLTSQLEATRRALEAQEARVQELESILMIEREARITIEEKWRNIAETPSREVDEDAASIISDQTITHDMSEPANTTVPFGTDEVSDDNGSGTIERLENFLRAAQEEVSDWRARAEAAERENIVKDSKILELIKELEADKAHRSGPHVNPDLHEEDADSKGTTTPIHEIHVPIPASAKFMDNGGRGAALVSMMAVVMLGVGLMSFLHDHVPKKDI